MSGLSSGDTSGPRTAKSRVSMIRETQTVELFDKNSIDLYTSALEVGDKLGVLAAETTVLLLRLAPWVLEDSTPDWTALGSEYVDGGLLDYNPTTHLGDPHGVDLISRAMYSLVSWKAYNYPALGTDLFAYTIFLRDIRDGASALTGSEFEFEMTPSIRMILSLIIDRCDNDTGWTTETIEGEERTKEFGDAMESEGRVHIYTEPPNAGYGSKLAEVVEWYTNLSDPLAALGKAMTPQTEASQLPKLTKRQFIDRLAPAVGLDSKFDNLPAYREILSPLAFRDNFMLGRYKFTLESHSEYTAYNFKATRDTPLFFNVENTDINNIEQISLKPSEFYAAIINYITSIHTPGMEEDFFESSIETFFGDDAVIAESDPPSPKKKNQFDDGAIALYMGTRVQILEVIPGEGGWWYRAKSLQENVVVNQKNWIPEDSLTAEKEKTDEFWSTWGASSTDD